MNPRALLVVLALLICSPLSVAHAKEDGLTSLDVAPLDAKFGLAVRGLNSHAEKARTLGTYMKQVGLEPPKFARVADLIADALDAANGKTDWPESMGLSANGAIAMYGVLHEGKVETILVMDVEYKKDFVRFMRRRVESEQWVEEGQKPKRALSKRKSAKGADQFTVTLQGGAEGQPVLTVRFKDGVAALSASVEPSAEEKKKTRRTRNKSHVLDHVAWSGTPTPQAFKGMTADPDRLSVGFWANPNELKDHAVREFAMLESVSGLFTIDGSGSRFEGAVKFAEAAKPFMQVTRPGPEGAKARQAMLDVAADSPSWARFSISTAAGLKLARDLAGKKFDEEMERGRKALGVDPVRDIAKIFTGDLLFTCNDGIADCVLALGVSKASKAERTVKALFTALSKAEPGIHFEHDRRSAGVGAPSGSVLLRTSVFSQEVDKRGRPDPKAERTDYARISWGVRPDLMVIGMTPQGVKRALKRTTTPETTWASPLPGQSNPPVGFDEKSSFASVQSIGEPSTLLRQLITVARHTLPPKEWTGIAARGVDAFIALYDRVLHSTSALHGEGLNWNLNVRVETLPSEGDKAYNATLDRQYKNALKERYEGRIRRSNEALLELATAAPKSPWGQKARLLVLGGDTGAGIFPLMGGAAGIAIEAFQKYQRRIRALDSHDGMGYDRMTP
ncbi:MAG: hypothetical protein ACPGU1_20935 [Myxococcota bacterium]